jgi:hypothetical protein
MRESGAFGNTAVDTIEETKWLAPADALIGLRNGQIHEARMTGTA